MEWIFYSFIAICLIPYLACLIFFTIKYGTKGFIEAKQESESDKQKESQRVKLSLSTYEGNNDVE